MVESSGGGGCRCACQEEFDAGDDSTDTSSGCCSPQVFTSVLLGILSCVLMTGGVFLAFHRWDPMWLIVSGVGVVLILIGTILHCCSNSGSQGPRRHSTGGKGCCSRPPPPEHHHSHLVANNGSLTEQLLPLSNARSVSQLSLNMLPGYFPPVVTAYGIEQHSAVVQNINRLVQQQQQQQQQQPSQNPGSASSGVISNGGKSFILLSLPGDTTPANIQNLVATVYQLDGSVAGETQNIDVSSVSPTPTAVSKPGPSTSLILKNAEVQTCNIWPNPAVPSAAPFVNGDASTVPPTASTSRANESQSFPPEPERSTVAITTQTEDSSLLVSEPPINLMDCSPETNPICDNVQTSCDSHSTDHSTFANIPAPSSTVLIDVSSGPSTSTNVSESNILVDIPDPSASSAGNLPVTSNILVDISGSSTDELSDLPPAASEVLVEISSSANGQSSCNNEVPLSEALLRNDAVLPETVVEINTNVQDSSGAVVDGPLELLQGAQELVNPTVSTGANLELSSSNSNLSAIDVEVDDGEFLDRSSPPPSYEDVTLEAENAVGAFGLAYGTI